MTDFVINLIKNLKKQSPQKDTVTNPKPNSKNDLVSSDPISLNEVLKGNIYCSEAVVIEKDGKITGHIHSKSCIVNGKVNGYILCSEYIEVKNTGIIKGDVKAGSIEIEAGSIVNGFISIDKKVKAPAIAKKMEEVVSINRSENLIEDIAPVEKIKPDLRNIPIKEEKISVKEEISLTEDKKAPDLIPEIDKKIAEPVKNPELVKEIQPKSNNTENSNGSWW